MDGVTVLSLCFVEPDAYPSTPLLMEEILLGTHYLQGFIPPRWCRISSINSSNRVLSTCPSPNPFLSMLLSDWAQLCSLNIPI